MTTFHAPSSAAFFTTTGADGPAIPEPPCGAVTVKVAVSPARLTGAPGSNAVIMASDATAAAAAGSVGNLLVSAAENCF